MGEDVKGLLQFGGIEILGAQVVEAEGQAKGALTISGGALLPIFQAVVATGLRGVLADARLLVAAEEGAEEAATNPAEQTADDGANAGDGDAQGGGDGAAVHTADDATHGGAQGGTNGAVAFITKQGIA